MTPLSTTDLQIIGGELVHGPGRALGAISIDSRTIAANSTFFCIRGPRFDGHDFALAAADAGARVIVCNAGAARRVKGALAEADVTIIAVQSTIQALGLLALRHRLRFKGTVVGLTGSSGKTTTKEMIAAVLATRGHVHRTPGNLNNHLGVPLTLLGLTGEHTHAVIEMGMSDRGEIAYLSELSRPHVGVITSVGAAHLETLKTVHNVAAAKGELLARLQPSGLGIIPSDVAYAWRLTRHMRAPLVAVGRRSVDDVRLTHVREGKRGAMARVHLAGEMLPLRLQLAGVHNLSNAALAIAVGHRLGVPLADAVKALANVPAPSMRGELRHLADGTPVVLDCYNANPQSTTAALAAFAKQHPAGIVVLGDMLELGDTAPAAHAALGVEVAKTSDALRLIAVGRHAAVMVQAAQRAGLKAAVAVPDASRAAEALADRTAKRPILLKGSRGVRLEQVFTVLSREEA
jgi:UDP-N-acetylmuramoyl-tripeptide--D-alanyl-D-alanine ligase